MRSIVVYKMIITTGILLLANGLVAQKPAIDLISSHNQYRHPEAIIDTGYAVNPSIREAVLVQVPPAQKKNLKSESGKKNRRQIGPSLDSIFQKEEPGTPTGDNSPTKISLFNRKYNPFKFLIYIIALK